MAAELLDASGVAVITGGASGFGLHMGQQLQVKGLHIAVLDVEPAALEVGVATLRGSPGRAATCHSTQQ